MGNVRPFLRELDVDQTIPTHQGRYHMSNLIIVLIGVLATVGALWWWFVRCGHECMEADRDAQNLFQQGELWSALALIDTVDAKCHCSRFTSGDAPIQYALAQV